MKSGFKITSNIWDGCKYVLVYNFQAINSYCELGRTDLEKLNFCIGFWKLKNLKK